MRQTLISWAATSSFLILAVIALRAALGKRMAAGLRYALWGLVLVRLLVPVQLFSSPILGTTIDTERVVVRETVTEREALDAIGGQDGPQVAATAAPVPPSPPDFPEAPEAPDWVELPTVLGWLWLAGGAAMALVLLGCNLRFYLRLRRTRRASSFSREKKKQKELHTVFQGSDCEPLPEADTLSICAGNGTPLPVYVADGLPSPCLFGVFRPAIYVAPETAADPAALRHILAHEGTHFHHGDHIWSLLRCAALCVHWWNPLVWLAAKLSRRDGELACDEGALKWLGDGERAAYGNTLLALVTAKAAPGDLLTCSTAMAGDKRSLKERFARIAKAPKRAVGIAVTAVALAALVTVCAFGQKVEKTAPWEEIEADLSISMEDDSTVRITGTVDGTTLARRGAFWHPGGWYSFSGSPYGELSLVYPAFTDGIEGHLSAWWADEAHTAVNLSTYMAAMCSSYFPVGYWEFTVDFSGGGAELTRMERSTVDSPGGEAEVTRMERETDRDISGGMEVRMYPETIADEEAVRAGRIAARLLTEAETYWAQNGAVPAETAVPGDSQDLEAEDELNSHFQTDGGLLGVPWEVVTAAGDWVREEYESYPERLASEPVPRGDGSVPAFDDWRVNQLSGPWTNTVAGVDVEVWRINYEFHTTEPDKAENIISGGMYLTEDGWLCPTYYNCTYLVYTLDEGGNRRFAGSTMQNSSSPEESEEGPDGVERFYARVADLLDQTGVSRADTADTVINTPAPVLPPAEDPADMTELPKHPDLNRNGKPETLLVGEYYRWDDPESATLEGVGVWEDGELLWTSTQTDSPGSGNAYLLVDLDNGDYLMEYSVWSENGRYASTYLGYDLRVPGQQMLFNGDTHFICSSAGEIAETFGAYDIADFMENINSLLARSTVLLDREGVFADRDAPCVSLSWLENFAAGFTWDDRASSLENLTRFKELSLNPPQSAPVTDAAGARAALRAAMLGETDFTLWGSQGRSATVDIDTAPPRAFESLSAEWEKYNSFAVVDLDGDGVEEVVYHVTDVAGDMGGHLILRWAGPGDLRCYSIRYSHLMDLKADGSFWYSMMAGMGGMGGTVRLSFPAPGYVASMQYLTEFNAAFTPETPYKVNGEIVSEEEYDAAQAKQDEKPDAVWYDFTPENVRKALG